MKPLFLEFCGINSFSEPAKIDFKNLLEFGLFGIFGDTGSGKSTILDCIGFALYGNVARSRSGSIADVINYKQESAYVHFEFEIVYEGTRRVFRVERDLKRKNASQSVRVFERIDGKFQTIADGVRESNALLERIIGLEQKDFEKCIALPQGEFAQFVKAQRGERLKLVSRLFDLESYGERLVKRTNIAYGEAKHGADILNAKLEPFAAVTAERCELLEQEILAYKEGEIAANRAYAEAKEREKALTSLFEKKSEAARAKQRLAALEAEKAEVDALTKELSRLERAAAVLDILREGRENRNHLNAAEAARSEAEKGLAIAEQKLAELADWNEEQADGEIARLTERKAAALAAEELRINRRRTEIRYNEVLRQGTEEGKRYQDFSYEKERAALDEALKALGAENFAAFAETHGKAALLRGEYAAFAGELEALTQKHPVIAADTAPLIEKYTQGSQGEKTDFSSISQAFEAREKKREALRRDLLALEQQKSGFEVHLEKLNRLREEALRLKEELAESEKKLIGAPDLRETEERLTALMREKREMAELRLRATDEKSAAIAALAASVERVAAAEKFLAEGRKRFTAALEAGGFADANEAEALIDKYGNAEAARARAERFRADYAAASAKCAEFANCDFSQATEETVQAAQRLTLEKEGVARELAKQVALAEAECDRLTAALSEKQVLERALAEACKEYKLYEQLKKLLEGNKFMEYVAEEYLQRVALNASGRLLTLTDGRYFLRYDGGFFVGDNFNGGKMRGVYTLSGGETFLVSLSLALALGAEICARSLRPIEFFFLDEGFGTLDSKLVDTVMDSLEKLRGEHLSIGIISHVGELKHRIDRKLLVVKATEGHGSQIISQ